VLIERISFRYAYFKKLTYFSTECIYSPDGSSPSFPLSRNPPKRTPFLLLPYLDTAYRGHARVFLKDLEAIRPSAIIDIIHSGESFELGEEVRGGMKAMREFDRVWMRGL
jgi:cytoplasmic tRNA 2-thiolation protein 1